MNVTYFSSGTAGGPLLASGKLDIIMSGDINAGGYASSGVNFAIVMPEFQYGPTFYFGVASSENITSPSQLVGKTIGVTFGGGTQLSAVNMLTHWGVNPSQVKLVNLSPAQALPAYQAGTIDGFFEPSISNVVAFEQIKPTTILESNTQSYWPGKQGPVDLYSGYGVILANGNTISNHACQVEKFLTGLYEAGNWIANASNKQAFLTAESQRTNTSTTILSENYNGTLWNVQSFSSSFVNTVQSSADQSFQLGLQPNQVNMTKFMDSTLYAKAVPSAVSVNISYVGGSAAAPSSPVGLGLLMTSQLLINDRWINV